MTQSTFTKRDIAGMALEELALANYVFDGTAEEDVAALRRMDALMASPPWSGIAYLQPTLSGASLPSDLVGIDDAFVDAVVANVAIRLAPTYGKVASAETRLAATRGKVLADAAYGNARLYERELNSNVVRGQGNRRRWLMDDPFFRLAPDPVELSALSLSALIVSLSA